jgi:hypothetical protein
MKLYCTKLTLLTLSSLGSLPSIAAGGGLEKQVDHHHHNDEDQKPPLEHKQEGFSFWYNTICFFAISSKGNA